jgi:hypothetical protein
MVFRNRSISHEAKFQSDESHLIRFVALVKIKLDIDFNIFFLQWTYNIECLIIIYGNFLHLFDNFSTLTIIMRFK